MSNMVNLKAVKIVGVTSLERIFKIAKEKGCAKSEVFVRITFEHDGKEYMASQRMMYLGEDDYLELADAVETGKLLDIDVDVDSGFFNIHRVFTKEERLSKLKEILADKPTVEPKQKSTLEDLL